MLIETYAFMPEHYSENVALLLFSARKYVVFSKYEDS